MVKEYIINSLEDIDEVAQQFIEDNRDKRVFNFKGKMGAGKTTFIKSICKYMDVEDNVCSPSFAIVNVYFSKKEGEIYHFDFYRLEKEEQALDIGAEDYLYSGNYCFIEWGENIKTLMPKDCLNVEIKEIENNKRKVIINS